jgi:hypothetical protein
LKPAVAARQRGRSVLWLVWALSSLLLAAVLGAGFMLDAAATASPRWTLRKALLPGATSHGHHQIELKCESCHSEAFGGPDVMQQACMRCHGAELKDARDSHPRSKFTDPRNADRAARLDAARCVTCHVEHQPRVTHAAGVTLPQDFCVICHRDIADDRPTHAGLGFATCASSGCHNFHDNRGLYEDFLVKHAGQPALLPRAVQPARDFAAVAEEIASYPSERHPLKALREHDGGPHATAVIAGDWLASAHARGGVNCSACHQAETPRAAAAATAPWIDKPPPAVCAACHTDEAKSFSGGKHGMRSAAGLGPMQPRLAHAPMKADAATRELGCTSCHGAHRFDTRRAAAEACLGCHDDRHSRAWQASPHAARWRDELAGAAPAGSGVSCASCHLPRVEHRTDDVKRVLVQHNQNATLRPNDKMLRSACLNCHGLAFSLDALADAALVERNFAGRPSVHVRSVEMALEAERRADASRRKAKEGGS